MDRPVSAGCRLLNGRGRVNVHGMDRNDESEGAPVGSTINGAAHI